MLDETRGILAAVSGGPDSVALLDMLMRLKPGVRGWGSGVREEQRGGGAEELGSAESPLPLCPSAPALFCNPQPLSPIPHLHVAHLDHMLRGRESAEDAEFVRALANRLGLQITISSVDVRAAAQALGRGIEEIAREIRYDFLLATANEAGCDRIAVGHTMTDQAETFLMRLIRGAGLRGLAAMRPVARAHTFSSEGAEEQRGGGAEGKGSTSAPQPLCSSAPQLLVSPSPLLIRPLLCITRVEVESYCRERGLEFRTDATNLSLHYTRNRIRNDVLPALATINPRVVESVSRAAENIAGDQDVLEGLAFSLLRNARLASDAWRRCVDGSIAAYSVTALLEQPVGMRRRMIIEAIRLTRAGATREEREAGCEVTSAHVAAVEALLAQKASGKHIALPGSLEVWREFDALVLKPIGIKEATYQAAISSECLNVEAGGFALTLQRGLPVELLESVIEGTRQEKQLTGRDWMTVALDDRALPEHLVIRPRLRGERAHVIGQRRTIKLKNLMIDHRIPSSRRATWPLVTTPDGAYIWSPSLPPALEFAAHDETQSLAIVRASFI
jgi:tRNA(Ile)-lysidine synthase